MDRRRIAISGALILLVSSLVLFGVLNLTNPTESGPFGILIVLVLIYAVAFGVSTLVAMVGHYTLHLIIPMKVDATLSRRLRSTYRRIVVVCAILSFIPIFLTSLNSIGRLGFMDVTLIAITEAVAIFYALKKMWICQRCTEHPCKFLLRLWYNLAIWVQVQTRVAIPLDTISNQFNLALIIMHPCSNLAIM